ncbi:hypothetical protein RJ55_05314 [Drechmeria coniospora]|nr:hypothetical protein RJ55_05314 [Drechmeria coniospora]
MMATGASADELADVSAAPDSRLSDAAQHAALQEPNVNGNPAAAVDDIENKRITSVEEQEKSADASLSGGSDTDASRTDWARLKDDDKGHGRTGGVAKKPATFKAVSVNKTFLASKSSPSSNAPKSTDRPAAGSSTPPPGSSTLSASRPRLVVKAGNAGRDSAPRFSSVVNGGKPASAPDPSVVWNKNRPPEPKKFTDEELKKYGIHMASRLNEEDAQGQNKWADIDDDDDDWAPEAITWGDGTKTTLPHLDEQLTPIPDTAPVAPKPQAVEKPKSPAPPASAASPLPKPSSSFTSGKGLILKPASQEKPALVAKPAPPPAAAKSPWAVLPPVDRASPASADAANLARGPVKGATTQLKEIAADDFNRSSWRDGQSHGARELYNSHSGRYEPVSDRRASVRIDPYAKQPALLQRTHTVPADRPAEPSSAFQTSRTSHDVPFARRRGSSNVSGGSGSYAQRMGKGSDGSMQSPFDSLNTRRASLTGSTGSSVAPGHPPATSQSQPTNQGWAPMSPTGAGAAVPQNESTSLDGNTESTAPVQPAMVDEVEYQKKLMRERVELARKRRQEEEVREEAAKRERIQKKLDALGPPPDKKSDKRLLSKDDDPKPTQIQQRQQPTVARPPSQLSGEERSKPGVDSNTKKSTGQDAPAATDAISKSPKVETGTPAGPDPGRPRGQEVKRADPWAAGQGPRPERFTSWAAGASPPLRNVWGSPDNDRGLGNGTFDSDLGLVPGATVTSAPGHKGPAPIAPPNNRRAPSNGPAQMQMQAQTQAPIGPHGSRYAATGSELASKWVAAVVDNDKKMAAARLAERAGRDRQLAEQGMPLEDVQPSIKDTWRPVHLPGDGTRRTAAAVEVHSHQPRSWKAPEEKFASGRAPVEEAPLSANSGVIGSGKSLMLPQAGSGAPSQSRPSRFFPSKDGRQETGAAAEPTRPASPSPPPPTMEGHPAYEGNVANPHVSFPKPQPVVKLPPAARGSQAPPQHAAPVGWSPRYAGKDSARVPPVHGQAPYPEGDNPRGSWQDRFDNLLNRVGKAGMSKQIGVDAASRSMLDHVTHDDLATVSLPNAIPGTRAAANHQHSVSKPMAEECFEEQEMGSLPQIRLPHRAPEAAWQPAVAQAKSLPKRFHVQASIMEPFYIGSEVGGGNAVRILFPGMADARIVTTPHSTARGNRGGHGRPSPRHRPSGQGSRGPKRESTSHYNGGEAGSGSSASRGGQGSYRPRGSDGWNRTAHAPPNALPSLSL